MILGKDDTVRMREAASIIVDTSKTMEERREAFGLLHDLVENVDNANNMAKMNLWPEMLSFLSRDENVNEHGDGDGDGDRDRDRDSKERGLRMDALRLVALAAKNNQETQNYLVASGVLDKLVNILEASCDPDEIDTPLIKKLIMALSAMAPSRGSPRWDKFMERQSASCFSDLLDKCKDLQDGLIFLVLNYAWSRGCLPSCLSSHPRLRSLITNAHFENCDDPECSLVDLPHRKPDN